MLERRRILHSLVSCFLLLICTGCSSEELPYDITRYNVRWETQSKSSIESMPVGGGDIGCNVWVENGNIMIYIARTGSFDENSSLLKSGRLCISTEPVFFTEKASFLQELHLDKGYVSLMAKEDNYAFEFKIWTDILQPVVRLEAVSSIPFHLKMDYENWRTEKRELTGEGRRMTVGTLGYPGQVYTWPDSVYVTEKQELVFFHRNRNEELFMWKEFHEQQLDDLIPGAFDPLSDLTCGGMIVSEGLQYTGTSSGKYVDTPFEAWNFETREPAKKWTADVVMCTEQTSTLAEWEQQLTDLAGVAVLNRKEMQCKNHDWWNTFWNRSWLVINDGQGEQDTGWRIGRNYTLFRYMMACNAYGKYPTKFNGGLLTTDPFFVCGIRDETPDYRYWGGGAHTCQNQRHLYWPLLKTGDFDFFSQQFDLYKNTLEINRSRSHKLWGHDGANYTEYLNIYGIPAGNTYGWKNSPVEIRCRPDDHPVEELYNQWTEGHYSSQLEFAFMVLKYGCYSGNDITEYLPFVEQATLFFDLHYRHQHKKRTGNELDENGKLVIYPSSALETYKNATNPTDVVAGLRLISQRLIDLPERYISAERKEYWRSFLSVLPEIPLGEKDGYKVVYPASSWSHKQNIEIPQLYVLFPFPMYGVGRPGLQLVIDTWQHGHIEPGDRNYISWMQGGIFTARMGLTNEAKEYAIKKLDNAAARFPAFWGPGHDWVPDHNWGGSGMIGLQDMLVQETEDKILLFPAWPKEWNVDFKLHGEGQSLISGNLVNGKLKKMKITPQTKKKEVEILLK